MDPSTVLAPYEATLKTASRAERQRWTAEVLNALVLRLGGLVGLEFEVHADSAYRDFGLLDGLRSLGASVSVPAAGLTQGRLLAFYRKAQTRPSAPPVAQPGGPSVLPPQEPVYSDERAASVTALLLAFGTTLPPSNLFPTMTPEAAEFSTSDPFAFLVASCLDRGRPAEIIWTIPYDLRVALGHLEPRRLAETSLDDLARLVGLLPRKPRYVNDAPRTLRDLATIVASEFGGDAAGVWRGRSAAEIRATLRRIHGVGAGIASMTVLLIERAFGVRFADLDRPTMDIKADVHTTRVLYRLGVSSAIGAREAVEAARRLRPGFPGEIDAPLWVIGRRWCHATEPRCNECAMAPTCPRHGI